MQGTTRSKTIRHIVVTVNDRVFTKKLASTTSRIPSCWSPSRSNPHGCFEDHHHHYRRQRAGFASSSSATHEVTATSNNDAAAAAVVDTNAVSRAPDSVSTDDPLLPTRLIDFETQAKIEGDESHIAMVQLRPGEILRTEAGAMLFMTEGVVSE